MPSAVSVLKSLRQETDIALCRNLKISSKVEHEFVDLSISLFLNESNAMQTCGEVKV